MSNKQMSINLFYLLLNNLCRVDSSTSTVWTGPFLIEGISAKFLLSPCFIEIPVFNANDVDPDQMTHLAASNLGLHRLQMSLLCDARHKWVKLDY